MPNARPLCSPHPANPAPPCLRLPADVETVEQDPSYIFRFPTPPDVGACHGCRCRCRCRCCHASPSGSPLAAFPAAKAACLPIRPQPEPRPLATTCQPAFHLLPTTHICAAPFSLPSVAAASPPILGFTDVDFGYPGGPTLFHNLNFGCVDGWTGGRATAAEDAVWWRRIVAGLRSHD